LKFLNINDLFQMSEFYYNLSDDDTKELIRNKLGIYGEEFRYIPSDKILILPSNFVYEALKKQYALKGINFLDYDLFNYSGLYRGTEIYNFYNIVPKSKIYICFYNKNKFYN